MDGNTGDTGGGSSDASTADLPSSVTIQPLDQVLALTVATPATIAYSAVGHYAAGDRPVTGTWALHDSSIGSIDPVSGTLTANAVVGGTTQVLFSITGGPSASTTVTVNLTATVAPPGTDPGSLFGGAGAPVTDAAAQASIVYPLDNVRFPQNITAPTVQWKLGSGSGGSTDWYRLTYTKPHITVIDYVQAASGFTASAALTDVLFSRIAETDPAAPANLVVDHLDVAGNRVIDGTPIAMSFANGSISGTVYYWSMDEARLQRIPAGTVNRQAMFPPNIVGTAATEPTYKYGSCIACHQISRDGRYLLANGDQSYIFDLTAADPTQPNMPVATRAGFRWFFATMSPDNTRVFATDTNANFAYTDIDVKARAATGTLPTTNVAQPSWSPDGKTVAFISNLVGFNSNASFTGGDLTTVNVDSTTDVFSNKQVIHTGSALATSDPAGGNADCFPSWSPDSKFLIFDHTKNTRGTGATRYDSSLYMTTPTAGATPIRLATATDSAGHAEAHYPAASPFQSGGFYWVVFYSTRDYGNAAAGTAGTARPQLWVTAVSTSFDGTHDVSSVPYWLPGQSTAHQNADGVWAPSPCKMTSASCLTSSDCCSGSCQPDATGDYVCTAPPVCRREGESCEMTSDCCGSGTFVCDPVVHACQLPPIQ